MTPEWHEQVARLYRAALELEPAQRAAYLAQACGGDEALRQEVESLLGFEARSEGLIDQPALEVAARAMAEDQAGSLAKSLVGQSIGHCRILSLLGKGGMGEVWLAEDTQLGRKVAVKLLPAEFTTDAGRVRRFAQEARAASALNHPNIITIHEIGEAEDTHYIVTEYVEGETLRQRMTGAPQKQMNPADAIETAAQIAAALTAAHEAGIMHRDIKPENVMVRRDGIVKVLVEKFVVPPSVESSRSRTLPPEGGTTNRRRRAAIVALAGLAMAAVVGWLYFNRTPALTEKDTILLADFENKTGDADFDGALRQGLAIQLEQSPFLNLFPEARVAQVLRLMERSPDERVTVQIAREICERENLKALIAGSIAPLGNHYVIALEARNGRRSEGSKSNGIYISPCQIRLCSAGRGRDCTRLRRGLGRTQWRDRNRRRGHRRQCGSGVKI